MLEEIGAGFGDDQRQLAGTGFVEPEVASYALPGAARGGEFAATDPTLARLIGRAPTALREVLAKRDDG